MSWHWRVKSRFVVWLVSAAGAYGSQPPLRVATSSLVLLSERVSSDRSAERTRRMEWSER